MRRTIKHQIEPWTATIPLLSRVSQTVIGYAVTMLSGNFFGGGQIGFLTYEEIVFHARGLEF
jgi:hypothetical protein